VSTKLNCLTITTDGCGTEKGCYMFPASCSNNCDFLVTYNVTSSNKVEFELSGQGDWVAVGFSDDQSMPDTEILMCVSNGSLSGHYYASERSTPTMTTPTPTAVTVIEQANDDGMMKCRISRDINPSPAIQNVRNLNEEVYLLGAIGSLSGVTIQQHSDVARQSSNSKITVTQAEDPTTTATAQGSFRIPDSCSSSDDCDFLVTYQRIGDTVEFELSGKAGWAGVGFSDDQNMADTDLLLCVSERSESGHYYAEDRTTPTMTTPTPSAVTILEHSNEGGVVKCRISRIIDPRISNFRDLSQPWFLLGAIGDFNGGIQQHSLRQPTASRITVTEAGSASSDDGILTNIIVHGTLMTLAWILFASVGLFTARYMRVVWEPKQLLGTKAWFTVGITSTKIIDK